MSQVYTQELRVKEVDDEDYDVRIAQYDNTIDLTTMDLETYMKNPVVLWNHDQDRIPIARTKKLRRNFDGSIDAKVEWNTSDPFARSVKKAWDNGYINAASIGFVHDGQGNSRAIEWSFVDCPADEYALRKSVKAFMHDIVELEDKQEAHMTNSDIEAMVKKTVAEHVDKPTFDKDSLGSAISEAVSTAVDERIKLALDERDAALKAASDAEDEKTAAEMEIVQRSESRADLLMGTKGMLPEEFVTKGKSDREIMVAALGDRVDDIQNKSDDYLKARLDMEIETRSQAGVMFNAPTVTTKSDNRSETLAMETSDSGDILSMIQRRQNIATS